MRRRRTRVVQRSAEPKTVEREEVEKEVELLELEEPKFISIVKSPANRMPFSIVRNTGGTVKRVKRAESALLSISLPQDISDEDLDEIKRSFGITDDEYEVERTEHETKLVRKKRSETEDPITMQIAEGVTAEIDKAVISRNQTRSDSSHPSLTVVKIRFTNEDGDDPVTREFAEKWLNDKSITFEKEDLFSLAGDQTFVRHDYGEAELKHITIERGIVADVAHTDRDDIPHMIYRQIVEEAYGSYGWGHLDFFQAMFDEQFSYDVDNALYWLRTVLDNILLYSFLPLSDRMSLVENATGEFLAWVTALMQSLPREVMSSVVDLSSQGDRATATSDDDKGEKEIESNENETKETADMSKDKQNSDAVKDEVKRDDEQEQETKATDKSDDGQEKEVNRDADEDHQEEEKVTLTRAELDELLESAADKAVKKVGETLQRGDEPEEEPEDPQVTAMKGIINDALNPIVERMDKFEETQKATIVRNDNDDADENDDGDEDEQGVLRSDENDWGRGALFPRNEGKVYGSKVKRG